MLKPLGLLGGAFDPIHNGHLRLAIEALEGLALGEVRFVPLADAHHRPAPRASGAQRVAMIAAAIRGEPGLGVDTREIERGGVSYTVDTLESLRAECGDRPLVWILGADAFAGLPGWRRWRELTALAHFAVVTRAGAEQAWDPELETLTRSARCADPAELAARPAGMICWLRMPEFEISASTVRARLQRGASARGLVPDPVLTLIREYELYAHDR